MASKAIIKKPGGKGGRLANTYFDGKELRDATGPMSFPVLSMDLAAAEAVRSGHVNDPERFQECLVAQACNRVFGPDAKVAIMASVAYISLPGEKYAHRYLVPTSTHDLIVAFDKKQKLEVGKSVELLPPTKSKSLDSERKRWREYRQRTGATGSTRVTTKKQPKKEPRHGVVRNGSFVRL